MPVCYRCLSVIMCSLLITLQSETLMPRTIWLLTFIQSLAMSAASMLILAGGVLGGQLSPSPEWSTLPLAMTIVGTAMGVVPITRLMQKFGRKPVFVVSTILCSVNSLFMANAVANHSFYGLVFGAFILGVAMASIQQIRFAAMEQVEPHLAPKAASTVMLGGLVAAILGPELVMLGAFVTEIAFVGAFYLMSGILLVCSLLFGFIKNTHVYVDTNNSQGRSISNIIIQPSFILAASASVVGYGLMSFIMTATPVHMHVVESHSLADTKWVIQSHIFAMFFPSLFSGWLISRFGAQKVIYTGLLAYVITILIGLSGADFLHYWFALVLLGIGWNFLFVGGTVLLGMSHTHDEKFKVQGANEFLVFGFQALASLSAGFVLNIIAWQGLLISCFAIIALQIVVIQWAKSRASISAI